MRVEREGRAIPPSTILVIEPSLTLRTIISIALHRAGRSAVHVYSDAVSALCQLRNGSIPPPTLILLTKRLRSLDGSTALRLLKQQAPGAVVVVVMDDEGYLERIKARVAGASAVLLKPYRVEELLWLVQRYAPGGP
jgi:DNA-binding response OmpR family regulator